jgi:hypothetical protein
MHYSYCLRDRHTAAAAKQTELLQEAADQLADLPGAAAPAEGWKAEEEEEEEEEGGRMNLR